MNIAFFEIEEWEKPYLQHKLKGHELLFFPEHILAEHIEQIKGCQVISTFVYSELTPAMFDALPNLKMLAVRATGYDNVNMEEVEQHGISVCNVPTYGENTVAEHAFALLLDLSRKIHQSVESVKKEGFSVHGLRGFDLKGKTLGIVGMGHIGQHVARIANGFEMRVMAFDTHEDKKLAKKLEFHYATLEELLKKSDIISLHAPYNTHTHHLINKENIKLIKKGAYLINTARGGLIETQALTTALDEGILAGVGLDVLEEEKFLREDSQLLSREVSKKHDVKVILQNHILMERENVIITPHNAFNSQEALERILETTVENIRGFIKGKAINIVI